MRTGSHSGSSRVSRPRWSSASSTGSPGGPRAAARRACRRRRPATSAATAATSSASRSSVRRSIRTSQPRRCQRRRAARASGRSSGRRWRSARSRRRRGSRPAPTRSGSPPSGRSRRPQASSAIQAIVRAAAATSAISTSAVACPDAAAAASWSSRRSTSPGRPVARCSATRASQQRRVALVERGGVVRPATPGRRLAAHHSVCTSRSPPWPSLRSGSSSVRDLAGLVLALEDPRLQLVEPALAVLRQFATPGVDHLGRQLRVAGDQAGGEQRRRRVEVVLARSSWSSSGAHGVAELRAGVPQRVPDRRRERLDATRRRVVDEQQVEVAVRRQLAAPVAADREQRHPWRPRMFVACGVVQSATSHASVAAESARHSSRPPSACRRSGPGERRHRWPSSSRPRVGRAPISATPAPQRSDRADPTVLLS